MQLYMVQIYTPCRLVLIVKIFFFRQNDIFIHSGANKMIIYSYLELKMH